LADTALAVVEVLVLEDGVDAGAAAGAGVAEDAEEDESDLAAVLYPSLR